jgi:8-oxo-dGTP pyrophosphatase MutT (NUDIX family)
MSQAGEREGVPPAPARDAATVILARDTPAGPEVLLLERHAGSRFAPGAFAFPGGRIEPADVPADAERLCRGLTAAEAAHVLGDVQPPERAIGFWIAALRELFEETSVLLAYGPDGRPLVTGATERARLAPYRARCRLDGSAFPALLIEDQLTAATDRLAYYAHWITPEERPIRYDTRFFVAAAFPDASPEPDGIEVVGHRWLRPDAALDAHAFGAITLPFVTQQILASLIPHPDVPALLAAARVRVIQPIRPRVLLVDGAERILLPGDPEYF